MSAALEQDSLERRIAARVPVIRSAKLICGPAEGIFDCLVLDQSASGVLIDLGAMVALPDELTIQFSGGAAFLAHRAWAAGTKAGLHLVGAQLLTEQAAQRMKNAADLLEMQALPAVVSTLRAARFLDHLELRRLAEEAEAAYLRFETFLRAPVGGLS
jgi:hypothetical protein